ncbi:hypothetical protein J2T02_001963 [Chitinophaga terrae (ex Kim and Jung 2007)]|uniref:glycoside hydrolase family 2 protein n=1 Tax=Chitinophaga terrae (ex Kim and Jung 2007) TaxID=408074 RepID=UPI00278272E6|nr:sugar-binding domain-containing protein [Chitinophaga terrae (ex Kim and Jung 2007)]MDQ0106850.1 hypothetical protein [Chitinophaga terrae (ex Kim and Jung 2007)]
MKTYWFKIAYYFLILSLDIPGASAQQAELKTRWNNIIGQPYSDAYPRPQLKRDNWTNLNGKWLVAITDSNAMTPTNFDDSILVPFPIESKLSGINKALSPSECIWYKKTLQIEKNTSSKYLLHFGAIDYTATIFLNGKEVFKHSGGYQSFTIDISSYLNDSKNELIVKVVDPTDLGSNPHGKQSLQPANIYYTSSSGIWQTVWIEQVKKNYVKTIRSIPNIDSGIIHITVGLNLEDYSPSLNLRLIISDEKKKIVSSTVKIKSTDTITNLQFSISNPKLWSPESPHLYDLTIQILDKNTLWDNVTSYFGMRKISVAKDDKGMDRIYLNNKYYYNLGVLDQGFWPEGLYTAPSDEALAYDIKAIKAMGFNTIRKHIKIEPERWYYYADKIGVLVWQDFVNPPHSLAGDSRQIFEKDIKNTINQLYSHPSIVMWVLFNEGWGAYDQARLTKWVKEYDASRLINGHSGQMLYTDDKLRSIPITPWVNSDIVDIHSYTFPRNPIGLPGKAKVIGEFGGISVAVNGHEWDDLKSWGYFETTATDFKMQYKKLIDSLKVLEKVGVSGSIYTQPFDVESEENGIITYDRDIIKIPIDTIRKINYMFLSQPIDQGSSTFHVATDMDPNDNDNKFEKLLSQYKSGNIDSASLRRLLLISSRRKDQKLTTQLGNAFIEKLKHPYSVKNLNFIKFITHSTSDKGFDIFLNNSNKVDSVLGHNSARSFVKRIIINEFFPMNNVDTTIKYDWDKLQNYVTLKFGEMGEEAILGRRMIEYGGFLGNYPDWEKYGQFYMLYFKKALKHPDYRINDVSWNVFLHVRDPEILSFATTVVKYGIEKWDQSPAIFDTYANLLHKIRQTPKAIEWESKALEMTKGTSDEHIFAETLQKMKDNKPTWPQN